MNYVGIDIGATNLKAGLIDEDGKILATDTMKIAQVSDQEMLAFTMAEMTRKLAADAGIPLDEVAAVGMGVPGTVDIRNGRIEYTCNLPLRNVPIRQLFHKHLPLPLYVENDANCAALGEYYAGAGRGSKRFVAVTLGTGIGSGIIHNGKIYHGTNGMAGEVGHMTILYGGESCACGRKGCWEQYASASALKRQTSTAVQRNPDSILAQIVAENHGQVSGQSAFISARRGDPVGQQVCSTYLSYLATGIVNIINMLQPDILAIGGGISNEADEYLLLPLRKLVEQESMPCRRETMTQIVKAELGTKAGMIGAAFLGKNRKVI